jgi:hypothetical protein
MSITHLVVYTMILVNRQPIKKRLFLPGYGTNSDRRLVNHCAMPSIGQTWVLASIGAVVEMGELSTLKQTAYGV